jgi:predicted amidohydrolase
MRVTSIQVESTDRTKAEVLDHVLSLIERARGSDLILLPELWPCGYFAFARYAEESEPVDGLLVQALAARARALGASLFTGSFVERERAAGRLFNTSLLIDRAGTVVARYSKVHLFGYQSEERRLLDRGQGAVVKEMPWGRAGLAICYDLRFPELFRQMIDLGAEVFLIASAGPPRGSSPGCCSTGRGRSRTRRSSSPATAPGRAAASGWAGTASSWTRMAV